MVVDFSRFFSVVEAAQRRHDDGYARCLDDDCLTRASLTSGPKSKNRKGRSQT
jgi:hypothetical protein